MPAAQCCASSDRVALVGGRQVLQTLSILIANIRSETNIFYLFSNNYINELICTPFDFDDDEIIGYYINLLKAIRWALRLAIFPRADGRLNRFLIGVDAMCCSDSDVSCGCAA